MDNEWKFESEVFNHLQKNGWFQKRFVNTGRYQKIWADEGYEVFPCALKFCSSFGEMKIRHLAYNGIEDEVSNFDPFKASQELDSLWVKNKYRSLAKDNLIPIGQGGSGHLTYFISESGKFFGGFDDYFCVMGNSLNDAFKNIFFVHNYVQI